MSSCFEVVAVVKTAHVQNWKESSLLISASLVRALTISSAEKLLVTEFRWSIIFEEAQVGASYFLIRALCY